MKGYKVVILFFLVAVLLLSSCSLPVGNAPTAPLQNDNMATQLVQTIAALSTQNAYLLPTITPFITNTPQPTETSMPTAEPTLTQAPNDTPTSVPTDTPAVGQNGIPIVNITPIATYYPQGAYNYSNGYGYSYNYNYGYPYNYRYPYRYPYPYNRRPYYGPPR
jgi:hypothetical protein